MRGLANCLSKYEYITQLTLHSREQHYSGKQSVYVITGALPPKVLIICQLPKSVISLNCCWHGSCQVVKLLFSLSFLMADIFIHKTYNRFSALTSSDLIFIYILFFFSFPCILHLSLLVFAHSSHFGLYCLYNMSRCQVLHVPVTDTRNVCHFVRGAHYFFKSRSIFLVLARLSGYTYRHVNEIIFLDFDWVYETAMPTVLLIDPLCTVQNFPCN